MTTLCAMKNCNEAAHVVPKLRIPALGWPLEAHQPIGMICDIPHCSRHRKKFKAKRFLRENPNIQGLVIALTANKCPPDFKRAFVDWVPLVSEEYGSFLRRKDKASAANA